MALVHTYHTIRAPIWHLSISQPPEADVRHRVLKAGTNERGDRKHDSGHLVNDAAPRRVTRLVGLVPHLRTGHIGPSAVTAALSGT
jgi:hypothetical protein